MRIAEMVTRLERLAAPSFMDTVKRRATIEILTLLAREFAAAVSPFGVAWAPLKYRKGTPLTKTGAMRDNATVYPTGSGIRIEFAAPYAVFHQYGTKNMPARPMLPKGELPKAWTDKINQAFTDAARKQVLS